MILNFRPIYGWGWFDLDGNSVDVPDPFQLAALVLEEVKPFQAAVGQLDRAGHPLSDQWILLTQRHIQKDGNYNLRAFKERPAFIGHNHPLLTKPHFVGFAIASPADAPEAGPEP